MRLPAKKCQKSCKKSGLPGERSLTIAEFSIKKSFDTVITSIIGVCISLWETVVSVFCVNCKTMQQAYKLVTSCWNTCLFHMVGQCLRLPVKSSLSPRMQIGILVSAAATVPLLSLFYVIFSHQATTSDVLCHGTIKYRGISQLVWSQDLLDQQPSCVM